MSILIETMLAYLINLASNERSSAIAAGRERKLNEVLAKEEALRQALRSGRSLRDELRGACVELARNRDRLGVSPQEEPLWRLLSDDAFQMIWPSGSGRAALKKETSSRIAFFARWKPP